MCAAKKIICLSTVDNSFRREFFSWCFFALHLFLSHAHHNRNNSQCQIIQKYLTKNVRDTVIQIGCWISWFFFPWGPVNFLTPTLSRPHLHQQCLTSRLCLYELCSWVTFTHNAFCGWGCCLKFSASRWRFISAQLCVVWVSGSWGHNNQEVSKNKPEGLQDT